MEIPVYLFTGFLEAGKTRFIQESLEGSDFNAGERTLLLLCEEGIEEYEPDKFFGKNVFIEEIENEVRVKFLTAYEEINKNFEYIELQNIKYFSPPLIKNSSKKRPDNSSL